MAFIPDIRPQSSLAAMSFVLDRHRRVIRVQDITLPHAVAHQLVQRQDDVGRSAHPAAQRRTIDLHPLAGKDLFEAVQRQMIGEFAGHHVRQQPRTGQSLFDRLPGFIRQIDMRLAIALVAMSRIAVRAGVFVADVLQDHEVAGKVLQLLALLLSDALPLLTAAGAGFF
jgi:hypothetical protein